MNKITFVLLLLWTSGTTVDLHSDNVIAHNDTTGRPVGRCAQKHNASPSGCGVPAIRPVNPCYGLGIIKGGTAKPHSWPWQVALESHWGSSFCGGSLINKDWVVTGAHCDVSKSHRVILGQHHLKNNISIQNIRIGKVINHPNYNRQTHDYDITLIKLASPAKMNRHVSPVCVAEACDNICAGTKCVATGWGRTRYNPPQSPNNLHQVCLPTFSHTTCQSKYNGEMTSRMFCAGAAGADTCHGDGGGPLVYEMNGVWILFGITSWGKPVCDSYSRPGVYTSIPHVRAWMDRTMAYN